MDLREELRKIKASISEEKWNSLFKEAGSIQSKNGIKVDEYFASLSSLQIDCETSQTPVFDDFCFTEEYISDLKCFEDFFFKGINIKRSICMMHSECSIPTFLADSVNCNKGALAA